MNCRRETEKMGVPPCNRPAVPRDWFPYLNGTSQGLTPEDARLPARRAYSSERRTAISVVAASDSCNIRASVNIQGPLQSPKKYAHSYLNPNVLYPRRGKTRQSASAYGGVLHHT